MGSRRVEGRAMIGRPPLLMAAPRTKSTIEATPERNKPLKASRTIWPVTSARKARLTETMLSLRAIVMGLLTKSVGRKSK